MNRNTMAGTRLKILLDDCQLTDFMLVDMQRQDEGLTGGIAFPEEKNILTYR